MRSAWASRSTGRRRCPGSRAAPPSGTLPDACRRPSAKRGDPGHAGAHVEHERAELALVLAQAGEARGVGRRDDRRRCRDGSARRRPRDCAAARRAHRTRCTVMREASRRPCRAGRGAPAAVERDLDRQRMQPRAVRRAPCARASTSAWSLPATARPPQLDLDASQSRESGRPPEMPSTTSAGRPASARPRGPPPGSTPRPPRHRRSRRRAGLARAGSRRRAPRAGRLGAARR